MNEFFHQDVFFFVTTIATVIVSVLLAILIIYLIRISRKVHQIVDRAKIETELIADDLTELRRNIKLKGARLGHFVTFFGNLLKRKKH